MDKVIVEGCSSKILVVDDDVDARDLLKKELDASGFNVCEACDGISALQILKTVVPDLILLDIIMPNMDGIAACHAIRAIPKFEFTPILMITGVDGLEYIKRAFDAGATDFINKTSNQGFVSQRIRYALRNSEQQDALHDSQKQLEQAQRVAKLGYWKLNINSMKFTLSEHARNIFNISAADFDNTFESFLNLVDISDRYEVKNAIDSVMKNDDSLGLDYRIINVLGKERYVHSQGEVIRNESGAPVAIMGTVQDITERKKQESTFEHLALYDGLTDLCNRHLFQSRLAHAMAMAQREEKLLAVCFLDLDKFKSINDNLGHAFGDGLLKSVAKRLKDVMRRGDIVARLSGDEFAIAVEGINSVEELEKIIEKIRKTLAQPYRIRQHELLLTASIGVTLYPLDGANRENLLSNADAAMYRAKQLGGNRFCMYTYDMRDEAHRRLDLEQNLRHAIEKNQLEVYYQPQIDVESGAIVGFEALVRWQHPDLGLLPPSKFVPIAEESGLIFPIGLWVMETACKQMIIWRQQGYNNLRLAINLSARQFAQQDMLQNVQRILKKTAFSPTNLSVEVTESVAMRNVSGATETLQQLKTMGAQVSIDDFGAGHTSMIILQRLPVDALNIDRAFVMNIADREKDGATAKAIIALAHGLGLRVRAEGVETVTQVEFLKKQKCDELQGFHFSPPIPADKASALLYNFQLNSEVSTII